MPYIRVSTPAGLLSDDQRADLAERLTLAIMKIETGGHDTPGFRSISALVFDEIAGGCWAIGGRLQDMPAAAVVDIRVPHGALDQDRRQAMTEASYRTLCEVSPQLAAADGVRRIWTHLFELDEGSWGAGDRIVDLNDVRSIASAPYSG